MGLVGIDGGGTRTRASIVELRRPTVSWSCICGKRFHQAAARGCRGRGRESARTAERGLRAGRRYRRRGGFSWRGQRHHARHYRVDHGGSRRFGVERSEVVGDEVIALDAAFQGGPGILQIAGTGSNTIGRAPDGSRESAGGWSSRLGDEGSGYWIGLHAMRRALKCLRPRGADARF